MTELSEHIIDWADPTTEFFWNAAREQRLVIQQCAACHSYQFYPRPFCLSCDSDAIEWVSACGFGTVYSRTIVHLPAAPELGLTSPYVAAIVELDEGPRLLTNLVSETCTIGSRVHVLWRPRKGQAPAPVFGPADDAGELRQ